MTIANTLKLAVPALAVATLAACGGGGGGGPASGSLKVAMTDAPACGYDQVNVTVQKVRVHQSGTANDNDAGWSEIVLATPKKIDLLGLTNGVLEELGQTALPVGTYTQMRLILADSTNNAPFTNSVVPTGGSEVALKTPSGQQSGVKANINIGIAANQLADFVVDFDACKSVVTAGSSGTYLLKPVVSVIPRYVSGVVGYVDPTLAGAATVSLQQSGVVIKASTPDSTGKVTLQPVAPGTYTLVSTAPGRTTQVVTGVTVAANLVTSLNASTTPLVPPVSTTGILSGTAAVNTLVRALQPLTSGSVEITGRFVDGVTGGYSFTLPTAAPLVAPYAVVPSPLVFSADTAAAGKYTLEATLNGVSTTKTPATLTTGATIVTNFP